MTDRDIELTRRKILASVGAVGVAGAGAGLGTSALFSDEESFSNNSITAGTLDMTVSAEIVAENTEYDNAVGVSYDVTADGAPATGLTLEDVKPGDWVIICFDITIGDNPGYVQVSATDFAQYENGQTEPEIDAEGDDGGDAGSLGGDLDGQGAGELQDELVAEVYDSFDDSVDSDDPTDYVSGTNPSLSGSARTVFEQFATGVVVGGPADPLEVGSGDGAIKRYLLLELPADVGNQVQSDAIEFDLVFDALQVRNNDGFDPSSNLVGYWPLNSLGGGIAEDLSGNGNVGSIKSNVAAVDGQVANAFEFDGVDDYVEVGDDPTLDIQEGITVSFWFYLTGQSSDNSFPRAVSKGQSTSSNGAYGVFIEDGNGDPTRIGLRFIDTDGNKHDVDTSNSLSNYDDGQWHHVAASYSNDDDVGRLWFDRTKEVDKSIAGDVSIRTTSDALHIGDGNNERHFNGRLDDVRIYDRALSDSEVKAIYDATNW